jgi:hypothetical protein
MDKEFHQSGVSSQISSSMSAYHNPELKEDYILFCFHWLLQPYPAARWELPLLKILFVTKYGLFFPFTMVLFCG